MSDRSIHLIRKASICMLIFGAVAAMHPQQAHAQVWTNANELYRHLKRACEVSRQVEEAVTDSRGNVVRDAAGNVQTKWVTRTEIDRGCVPQKFPNLRLRQYAKFLEVDERTFGSDYVFFNAGDVDLKCKASSSDIRSYKATRKGASVLVEGTVLAWEWRPIDDNFVMHCSL